MLTKKDVDAIDEVQSGRKDIGDTHLADAASEEPENPSEEPQEDKTAEAHKVASEDDGKLHIARDFGEAIADILIPEADKK